MGGWTPLPCAFCSIASGRAPATVLGADDLALAFLARHPLAPGHTLVVPRRHAADMSDVTETDLAATMLLARRVGTALVEELGAGGFNLLSASGAAADQSVFHLHLHIVPRWEDDGLRTWPTGRSDRSAPEGFAGRVAHRLDRANG